MIASGVITAFSTISSSVSKPFFLSIGINLTKISAVAPASSTAL